MSNRNNKIVIKYLSAVLFLLVIESCGTLGTQYEREEQARLILSGECNLITGAVTEVANELSDKKLLSGILNIAASLACNCITKKIVPRMAENLTLNEIKNLRGQPIKLQKEIATVIKANKQEVNSCFKLNK